MVSPNHQTSLIISGLVWIQPIVNWLVLSWRIRRIINFKNRMFQGINSLLTYYITRFSISKLKRSIRDSNPYHTDRQSGIVTIQTNRPNLRSRSDSNRQPHTLTTWHCNQFYYRTVYISLRYLAVHKGVEPLSCDRQSHILTVIPMDQISVT